MNPPGLSPLASFRSKASRDSVLERLDPRIKVLTALGLVVSLALLPDGAWSAYLLAGAFLAWGVGLAGLPARYALTRSLIALPFILPALTLPFTLPGETIAAFDLGAWTLAISGAGLLRFGSILVRSLLSVLAAVVLIGSTPFPDLLHALRHLGVPRVLVAIMALMYRYLFLLKEEAERLMRARAARSGGPGRGGTLGWRARVAGNMVGQLFVRGIDRSERVYDAMQARGFQGEFLTLAPHRLQATDWAFGALALALILALQLLPRL
jgi:cobalt/nickel transport system permease protein